MKKIKLKITFYPNEPDKTYIVDENNYYMRYFYGLDGKLFENYGTKETPVWAEVFDADYDIEFNEC